MRYSALRCSALALAAIPSLSALARGTTYVVDPDGTGDFPTIQAAVNAVHNGDIIELTDGTFAGDGNRDIEYLGKAITVRSQSRNPETCVIDCEGSEDDPHRGFIFSNHEGAASVLEGITITRAHARGNGGGILCDNAEPTVANIVISECFACNGGGAALETTEGWPAWGATFVNCVFAGNSCDGPHCWGGGVLVHGLDAPSNPTFINCTFTDNWAGVGGGMICSDTWQGSPIVSHCTFSGNHASTCSGICSIWLHPPMILENTIIAFGTGGAAFESSGLEIPTLTCCDIHGNQGGDWVGNIEDQHGVDGNISLHPLFCAPENGDFTLAENSPCAPFSPPNAECDLIGAWPVGCGPMAAGETGYAPLRLQLGQGMPNPFATRTAITYDLPPALSGQHVVLRIYDLAGRLVRSLVSAPQTAGARSARWDGTDSLRRPVAAGVYLCRLAVGDQVLTRRLVLIR